MKKLFFKLFIFAIPFIVMALIIIKVDPYNYLSYDSNSSETKKAISYKLNYALWKTIEYRRNPLPNILLGDSQMGRLRSDDIFQIAGEKFYNFSYAGGTLAEMINTFWFATETTKLKSAYFGISFNHFNVYNNSKDRVTGARQIINNPLLYLVNRNVLSATVYLIKNKITGNISQIERPKMNRKKFWTYNLNIPTRRYYTNYKYPRKWYEELRKISEFCRENGVNLKIIILPTHTQLQLKVQEYGLAKEYEAYLKDLAKLAVVYNFNIKNSWTEDQSNFDDPRHFRYKMARELIHEIWGLKKHWVRVNSDDNNSN